MVVFVAAVQLFDKNPVLISGFSQHLKQFLAVQFHGDSSGVDIFGVYADHIVTKDILRRS